MCREPTAASCSFSRKSDIINLPENAVLTPLSIDDDISSLSAILLNDEYYEFLKQGIIVETTERFNI
jgi:hypothetical protein